MVPFESKFVLDKEKAGFVGVARGIEEGRYCAHSAEGEED
jgi:hypothetical protein